MAPDLQQLLRGAAHDPGDGVDLDDIARRAGGLRRTRRGAALVALVVVAASTVGAISLVTAERPRNVDLIDRLPATEQADTTPAPPQDSLEWETLPESPLAPRAAATGVWTGTEVLIWGGAAPVGLPWRSFDDGAAYNPAKQSWRRLPAAPIPGRWDVPPIWTGEEMIVVSGTFGPTDRARMNAAYDPEVDAWRVLSEPPHPVPRGASAVWTGTEVLIWGGYMSSAGSDRGLAYEPVEDAWRELARAPIAARIDHAAGWTGEEMIVWGGRALDNPGREPGAAYDPSEDSWRVIADGPLAPRDSPHMAWTGSSMLVVGGTRPQGNLRDGAAYDPGTDTWTAVPAAPRDDLSTVIWTPYGVLARGGQEWTARPQPPHMAALLPPGDEEWIEFPDTYAPGIWGSVAVVAGTDVIVWGGVKSLRAGTGSSDGASLRLGIAGQPTPSPLADADEAEPSSNQTEEPGCIVLSDSPSVLWPADKVEEPWARDASDIAEAFGREVLGWPDAELLPGEPTHGGTAQFSAPLAGGPAGSQVYVGLGPREGWLREPIPPGTEWALAWVQPSGIGTSALDISVGDGRAEIRYRGRTPDAASADLVLRYGDEQVTATTTDMPPTFDVQVPFPTCRSASVLVLFRDEQGGVMGAAGTGLPPGPLDVTASNGYIRD